MIGEVVRSTPPVARMKDAAPALTPDVAAKYAGRAAVIATSVINAAMTDLAKRLPPPITPEEEAFSKVMKQVGPGFNALRQAATESNAADATAQAAALKRLFTESGAFWKTKTRPDAIQWAEDAKLTSDAIATAAGKGDWDTVKTTVPKLQQLCASCHGLYRERLDDGTYRYKAPAGARPEGRAYGRSVSRSNSTRYCFHTAASVGAVASGPVAERDHDGAPCGTRVISSRTPISGGFTRSSAELTATSGAGIFSSPGPGS